MSKQVKRAARVGKKPLTSRNRIPAVTSLLVCDGVAADPTSGKTTLYGVFDRVLFRDRDSAGINFFTFAKASGGSGDHKMGFVLVSPSGKRHRIGEDVNVHFEEDSVLQAISIVTNFKFIEEGTFFLFVTAEGREIGSPCPLVMRLAEKTESAEKH